MQNDLHILLLIANVYDAVSMQVTKDERRKKKIIVASVDVKTLCAYADA